MKPSKSKFTKMFLVNFKDLNVQPIKKKKKKEFLWTASKTSMQIFLHELEEAFGPPTGYDDATWHLYCICMAYMWRASTFRRSKMGLCVCVCVWGGIFIGLDDVAVHLFWVTERPLAVADDKHSRFTRCICLFGMCDSVKVCSFVHCSVFLNRISFASKLK